MYACEYIFLHILYHGSHIYRCECLFCLENWTNSNKSVPHTDVIANRWHLVNVTTQAQNNRIPKIVICCFAIDVWEPFLARFVGSHAIFRCDIFDYYLSCFRELFSGIKVPKHKIELLNLQWKFSDIVLLNVSIYICGSRQILRLIFQHRCKFCISNIAEQ